VKAGGRAAAPRGRRLVLLVAGVVLLASAPVARVLVEGRAEERASAAALSSGDVAGATVHARRAATAYEPFAPHVDRAYQRLRAIALDAETRGNPEAALFAWRAVRSASIGSSHVAPAAARERRMADTAIARLQAAAREASLPGHRANAQGMVRLYAEDLAADRVPARGRIALLLGGVVAVVAGGVGWTRRALAADGRIDVFRAKGAAAVAILGAVAWIVGLLLV
jgi:hypothetical protein